MHVKHFFQPIGCIGVQIGFKRTQSLGMQVLIFFNKGLKLLLDVSQLIVGKLIMVQFNFSVDQMLEITFLLR
jgi:hypothetical protein